MKNKIFAFICTWLVFWACPVFANEVIHSFDSLIQVQTDGSMIVTETITVHHEGIKIRRGIYRDLPTKKGERYELIGVRRNGYREPSFVEKRSGYYRINTGDDRYLHHPDTSVFEIQYRVWNLPKSYNGYDEVYWNVTGNEWAFPIESVSAQLELPVGAEIIQQASYIGYTGSRESATYEGRGLYLGRALSPGEQLTIAVGFTPGIVSTKPFVSIGDVLQNVIPGILYIIYLVFLIWAWNKNGRDPAPRAIMPQYTPPKDLTAAQAVCLYHKSGTKNLFSISLIQMVTNGFLKMSVKKEKKFIFNKTVYTLEKTGQEPSNVEEECFSSTKKINLDGEYHPSIARLAQRVERKVEKSMKEFYATNRAWVLLPTFLCFYLIFLVWSIGESIEGGWLLMLFCSIILTGLCSFICRTMIRQILYILLYTAIAFVLYQSSDLQEEQCRVVLALCIIATGCLFSYLMYQPTENGQRKTEYLEGLKLFLTTLKKTDHSEDLTKKCMEKLFPYAMVLELETAWEKKFEKLFGKVAYQDFVNHHPYTSHSFCSAFTSSANNSSTSHSSGGSGSGGGGGAGGGGGGGGGGGR